MKRTLFANKHYGGCPRDSGWLVVVDWPYCGWEKAEPSALPRIIYSKVDTVTNWNTAGEHVCRPRKIRQKKKTTTTENEKKI